MSLHGYMELLRARILDAVTVRLAQLHGDGRMSWREYDRARQGAQAARRGYRDGELLGYWLRYVGGESAKA
jgi:hypothetical protein